MAKPKVKKTESKTTLPRPAREIKVESLENPIVMNYLMMNDIMRFVGGVDEAVSSILTSQETRDIILRRLLTETNSPVDSTEELIPVNEVQIDIFDIDIVLSWVVEHISYFFTRTSTGFAEVMAKNPLMATKIPSNLSPNGSQD